MCCNVYETRRYHNGERESGKASKGPNGGEGERAIRPFVHLSERTSVRRRPLRRQSRVVAPTLVFLSAQRPSLLLLHSKGLHIVSGHGYFLKGYLVIEKDQMILSKWRLPGNLGLKPSLRPERPFHATLWSGRGLDRVSASKHVTPRERPAASLRSQSMVTALSGS